MSPGLNLITCASFGREIEAVRSSPDLSDVRFISLPTVCDLTEARWPDLAQTVAACAGRGGSTGIVGGYCLSRPCRELGPDAGCRLHQESQCLEWVADRAVLDRMLRDGALPVLPGWIENWESHIDARWPGDRKAAQAFYRDVARKVVLVDTGANPGVDRELRAFGRFLKLPVEVLPAGVWYTGAWKRQQPAEMPELQTMEVRK